MILASASPRRKELLLQSGYKFKVIEPDVNENLKADEDPRDYITRISKEKVKSVARELDLNEIIIAADTIVLVEGLILGKPKDSHDAKRMLDILSGNQHSVISGFVIMNTSNNYFHSQTVETKVTFRNIAPDEIEGYIKTGEPFDKAGAYAIQGQGASLVKRIEGSYTNVVGLPLAEIVDILDSIGVDRFY